jgi:3-methylcrotonyl-CoA carboxylase alpha subunit
MFKRILIANRGEIACRILRTCRRLGTETVAVYSEADVNSRHVAEADFAVLIGPGSASESYLRADRIVAAALSSGAQAIHPGYGFLSEKLELIDACLKHGIAFVGPNRRAIEAMGSKIESKRLARRAGVVCVPGYDEDEQTPERLLAEAQRIGFPLLIKASAGGGGKGMRRVNASEEFLPLLALARKEALASFADERVLLEKYIVNPRHIEVQIVGDQRGGLVHLFERDCSIQRRFQKVIEEAPANHLSANVASRLYESALRIGSAMSYDNAGTVEFVLDADEQDAPYFLEVNTRLQVEHLVTEMTTGIDLVEWQLRIASGEPLPMQQAQIARTGWAIECRLNAEQPEYDFRSSLGHVLAYAEPQQASGVRIDSGLHDGSDVTPYYDSMQAKVIGYGASRSQAIVKACQGIESLRIEGVCTNAAMLLQILRHQGFDAVLTTRFLETHFPQGTQPEPDLHLFHTLAVAAAWAASQRSAPSVWGALRGFRITAPGGQLASVNLRLSDVSAALGGETVRLTISDDVYRLVGRASLSATVQVDGPGWIVQVAGQHGADGAVHIKHTQGRRWFSWLQGRSLVWDLEHELEHSLHGSSQSSQERSLSATLPGRVSEIMVQEGEQIEAGAPVLVMEAMKLYHTLVAPLTGRVSRLHVTAGDIVAHGQLLVELEPQTGQQTVN